MGRYFAALFLALLLTPAPGEQGNGAQHMFFSMLFPHLIPPCIAGEALDAPFAEAVAL